MNDDHIFDSQEKIDRFVAMLEECEKSFAMTQHYGLACSYLGTYKKLVLPYKFETKFLETLSRENITVPVTVEDHVMSGPSPLIIPREGDILYGFEIRTPATTSMTRVEVTSGDSTVWSKKLDSKHHLSLKESLDGLTYPLIAYPFNNVRIKVYNGEKPIDECSIRVYHGHLDSCDRRITARYFSSNLPDLVSDYRVRPVWIPPPFAEWFYGMKN